MSQHLPANHGQGLCSVSTIAYGRRTITCKDRLYRVKESLKDLKSECQGSASRACFLLGGHFMGRLFQFTNQLYIW